MSRPYFALSVMLSLLAASLLAIRSTNADETGCPWSAGSSSAGWNGCADYSDCDYHDYEYDTESAADDATDDDVLDEFFGADVAVTAPSTASEAVPAISDEELWDVFDAATADAVPETADVPDATPDAASDIPWESILESVEEYDFVPASDSTSSATSGCDLEATGDQAFDEAMGVLDEESTAVIAEPVSEVQQLLAPTGLMVWAAERCQSSPDPAWLQDVVARAIRSALQLPTTSSVAHDDDCEWTCELAYEESPVDDAQAGVLLTTATTLDRMAWLLTDAAEALRDLAGQRVMVAKQPEQHR